MPANDKTSQPEKDEINFNDDVEEVGPSQLTDSNPEQNELDFVDNTRSRQTVAPQKEDDLALHQPQPTSRPNFPDQDTPHSLDPHPVPEPSATDSFDELTTKPGGGHDINGSAFLRPDPDPSQNLSAARRSFYEDNPVSNQDSTDAFDIPNLRQNQNVTNQKLYRESRYDEDVSRNSQPSRNTDLRGSSRRSGGSKIHVIILIIIGLVVIGATVYLLKNQFNMNFAPSKPTPAPTVLATATPSPTPEPTPDRSAFKIDVLNGTPKAGLAGITAKKLKEQLGYQIGKTGNATNSAFARTQVLVKPGKDDLLKQLIQDLAPDFDASASGNLKEDAAVDGQVILGQK